MQMYHFPHVLHKCNWNARTVFNVIERYSGLARPQMNLLMEIKRLARSPECLNTQAHSHSHAQHGNQTEIDGVQTLFAELSKTQCA